MEKLKLIDDPEVKSCRSENHENIPLSDIEWIDGQPTCDFCSQALKLVMDKLIIGSD